MDSFNFLKTIAIISVFILFLLIVFLLTVESGKNYQTDFLQAISFLLLLM
jgi:hypothetical protein